MKHKIIAILVLLLVLCGLLLVDAENDVSLSLAGNEGVYAGDVLSVTVKISGSEINKVKGMITYNNEQLELKSITPLITEPWVYTPDEDDNTDGDFLFEFSDATNENPLNGETELLTIEFTVLEIPAETEINVLLKDILVTINGEEEINNFEDISFTSTVMKVLSENNFLTQLNVTNAKISPTFNKEILNYTSSVPFSVNKLEFTALTEESSATMKVNNPELVVNGKTNVTITVTSETNTKRVYTIIVTRAQDPNYVKSNNNKLSAINVGHALAPNFNPDVTDYIMEIPYENFSVSISASVQDSKSSYVIVGGKDLVVGDNTVKITCTAEDGSKKTYNITVKRLAEEGTATAEPTQQPTEEPTPVVTTTNTPEQTSSTTDQPQVIVVSDPKGMPYLFVIILIIVFFGIGFIFGMSINIRKKDNDANGDIVESDFERQVPVKKNKDMLFIVEDNLRDDDK